MHCPLCSCYHASDHFDTCLRLFHNLSSWSRCFYTPVLNDSHRSYGYRLHTAHSMGNVQYDFVPICGYGPVTVGAFGVVPLRKNVPVFFLLLRASDFHRVHGPGRHSLFLRPGHDFKSSFYRKRLCRRSASMQFWVKFIYTAGISSLCDMVGMCTVMSFAFCSSG